MSVLDRVLRALGVNPVQLRWRLHRLRERYRRGARSMENRSRALSYRHQVCPQCGLTSDRGERRCPRCDHPLRGVWARRLAWAWRTLVPAGTYTYTAVLVAVNVAFYAAMVMSQPQATDILSMFGRGIPVALVERFGAWTVAGIARGELWRLLSSCFLHFGLLHLLFNGLWLVQLGPALEQHCGRSRFLLLFLASGAAGMGLSVLYRYATHGPLAPHVGAGASGVVFGLIGAALVRGYLRRLPGSDPLRGGMAKWALYALLVSLLPGVDLVAHLGGAAGGASLGAVLGQGRAGRGWLVLELCCLVALLCSFAAAALGG